MCKKRYAPKNTVVDTSCRRCGKPFETLRHILGECIETKPRRIKRHNEIRDLLNDRLSVKHQVMMEHSFRVVDGELLRPDLVVKTNETEAAILDVTVRFECENYLKKAAEEKISKYKKLYSTIKREMGYRK